MKNLVKDAECLDYSSDNGRVHIRLRIDWLNNPTSTDTYTEEVELWGILDNLMVTRVPHPRIENILYVLNTRKVKTDIPADHYFYSLPYFAKAVPSETDQALRSWVIDGTYEKTRYKFVKVPNEGNNYVVYDIAANVLIPLAVFDFLWEDEQKFKDFITKNFPTRAKISPYYLTNLNTIRLQWHLLGKKDSYYTRDLLLEDVGIYKEQIDVLRKSFKFTCPVSRDFSPAGQLGFPKPFYERNKHMLVKILYHDFTMEISDPYSDISELENVIDLLISMNATDISPRVSLTYKQYRAMLDRDIILPNKSTYKDYISMAKQIREPFVMPWDIHSERELHTLHDNMIAEYNLRKNTSAKELKDQYLRMRPKFPKFEYENSDFGIIYPEDIDDLSIEGTALHHCVGSYKNRVLNSSTLIMFLRKLSDPTKPFVTLQVSKVGDQYDLVQAHGKCNCSISTLPGVEQFVNTWCSHFHIKKENINRCL